MCRFFLYIIQSFEVNRAPCPGGSRPLTDTRDVCVHSQTPKTIMKKISIPARHSVTCNAVRVGVVVWNIGEHIMVRVHRTNLLWAAHVFVGNISVPQQPNLASSISKREKKKKTLHSDDDDIRIIV